MEQRRGDLLKDRKRRRIPKICLESGQLWAVRGVWGREGGSRIKF